MSAEDNKGFTKMEDEAPETTASEGIAVEEPVAKERRAASSGGIGETEERSDESFGKNPNSSGTFKMNSQRKSNDEVRKSLLRHSDLGLLRQKSTLPVSSVNPFVGTWKRTEGVYNRVKTVILFPIAIIRLFFCIIILLLCSGWCKLALSGVNKPEDIGNFRRNVVINPMVQVLCRAFLFVMGFYWIPVRGKRDRKARVMIANHTTMIDVVVLLYACVPAFLSKATVLQVPLIGAICSAMQVIGVDRGSAADRDRTRQRMKDHIGLLSAPPLLVFPEGTTCRYDTVLRFKPGAFEFGLPVQPVLLHWRWNFTDPSSCATTNMRSWAMQMLCQFYHYVEVEYLPVLVPDAEEQSNAMFFTNNAHKILHKGLNRRSTRRTCTPGFVHDVYEVTQNVDDFLVWKRLLSANMQDLDVTLQSFSLESIRDAIEVAAPVLTSRKRIDLSFAMAAAERYARVWHCSTIPGHQHKSLLCYEDLILCMLGDHAGAKAKQVFLAAFLEAAVFPCFQAEAVDFRQFCTALIWLSNVSSVWGTPFSVFLAAPTDKGVVKWATVRAKIAHAFLCSQQVLVDDVCREDVVKLLGDHIGAVWDEVFPVIKGPDGEVKTKKHFQVTEFKDAIVNSLCAPEDDDPYTDEESVTDTTDADNASLRRKKAAYKLVEACFAGIDANFRTRYFEGGSFFLTEKEVTRIQEVVVPIVREQQSVEDEVVEDPSEQV